MKLRDGFITYSTGEEQIMVAAGSAAERFRGMVRSNATAAYIIDCLGRETTPDALVDKMSEKYDAPRAVIERDVQRILDALRQIGALDE